jgi:3-dehydroquinate dehydratase/shikimate dehydrogenase
VYPLHCPCLQFKVVFDAVYTPRETRLLRDAAAAGCLLADGVAMFVGQAVEQLKLFTGTQQPPVQLMEDVVLGKVKIGSS